MSNRKITAWAKATIQPSAPQLAEVFWAMDEDEQSAFFNRLSEIAGDRLIFQLSAISRSENLAPQGRIVMQQIGEYGEP